jgi:tetratricopeptide (TPR) repeat protein
MAAQCWHESGRLLERQAGRLPEAWICYSRALALFPDHKPSISALRRLARVAGDDAAVERLIEAQCERPSHPSEQAALLTDLGAVMMRQGRFEEAMVKLQEAAEGWPKAIVPKLLLACAASAGGDAATRIAAMERLADSCEDPAFVTGLKLLMSRIEEQQGRFEKAFDRLGLKSDSAKSDLPLQWARFRLNLKQRRMHMALGALDDLERQMGRGVPTLAFGRMRSAIQLFLFNAPTGVGDTVPSQPGVDNFLELMRALRRGIRTKTIASTAALRQEVETPKLKEALAISQMLEEWEPAKKPELSLGEIDAKSSVCKATMAFLQMGAKAETRVPEIPAAALQRAMRKQNWHRAAEILGALRRQTTDRDARWPLAVAEAGIRIEHLGQGQEALADLVGETAQTNRRPLPAIMRRFESGHRQLATLAMAEAKHASDAVFKAARLAWAAYHLESTDPFESARLYTESLSINPSLLLSIAGLARTVGTGGAELAKLYLVAAESTEDPVVQARSILHAGMAYLAVGRLTDAAALFGDAALDRPDDAPLQATALGLVLLCEKWDESKLVQGLLHGRVRNSVDPKWLGAIALMSDPTTAAAWFEKALAANPSDHLAERGYTEALILAERPSILSERLLAQLRVAKNAETRASIYAELAHIDRFLRDDTASAALSLLALDEMLPGHRPTLVQLVVYFLGKHRKEDARRILTSLASTVSDERDVVSLKRFQAMRSPKKRDLLKSIFETGYAELLDLTELEGLCKDPVLQTSILTAIAERLPDSEVYASRLADSLGRSKEYERAVACFEKSAGSGISAIYDLHAMAKHVGAVGDYPRLIETLARVADCWTVKENKVNALLEAGRLARDRLSDPARAVSLWIRALSIDPSNESVYEMAEKTLSQKVEDDDLRRQLLEARLKGVTDPLKKYALNIKLRDLLKESEAGDSTRVSDACLSEATDMVAVGPRESVEIEGEADVEAFDDAVYRLTTEQRPSRESEDDETLLVALGETYLGERNDEALAEKYFKKALDINAANPAALARLAELCEKKNDMAGAADLLDKLIKVVSDPSTKIKKMLSRAEILMGHLDDEKGAEGVLQEACRVDALAREPIVVLAQLYLAQGDQVALNVHLNAALAAYGAQLAKSPDDEEIYETIQMFLKMKGDKRLYAIAEDARRYLQGKKGGGAKVTWKMSHELGDFTHDDLLCPRAVTIGLRETIRAVERPLAELYKVGASALDVSNLTKLKRRDKLASVVHKMAPQFGFKDVDVWVGNEPSLAAAPGSPPSLIFPEAVCDAALGARRFAAAAALQTLRWHLGIVTLLDPDRVRTLLFGLAFALDDSFKSDAIDDEALAAAAEEIEGAVGKAVLELLTPSIPGLLTALENDDIVDQLMHVGHRAGFMAAGSLANALAGLRVSTGVAQGPLSELPGAGAMVAFALSRDHTDLSGRFGAK